VSEDDPKQRLARLEERIAAAKKTDQPKKSHGEHDYSRADIGWRMVTELVAGLLIGFGIGYGLDRLLGTLPIFLVLFTLLGLAAGIKVMLRSAQELQKDHLAQSAGDDERK